MKLYIVRIFVRDWLGACEFYEHTLGLSKGFSDEPLGWAEFDVGGAKLGVQWVSADDDEGQALVGRFLGVSLNVDDIQQTYAELSNKGVVFTAPPKKQPWGGLLAHFRDPEGNVLTLVG